MKTNATEMDYKKEYEAMVQRAKELHEGGNALTKLQMEIVCPELAESGDERMINELQGFLASFGADYFGTGEWQKFDDWLEKQKDIKPLSWRAVDECKDIPDGHYVVVAYNSPGVFELDTVFNGKLSHPNRGNLKAAGVFYIPNADENTMCIIEKQKPDYCHHEVDLSGCSDEYSKGYYDGWNNCNQQHSQLEAEQKPAEWSYEDESNLKSCIGKIEIDMQHWGNHGKTMVDGDIKLIDWLKSLPERFNLQPKQEWSDEDRKTLNTIISDGSRGVEFDAKQVNFLKSLCPQYRWKPSEQEKGALRTAIYILTNERNFPKAAAHLQNILDTFEGEKPRKEWKPSEEQMRALKEACDEHWEPDGIEPLYTLYQDLKKL